MMYKFYVKTGILFLILCVVSGLPHAPKKIEDGNLKSESGGSEVKTLFSRLKRNPSDDEGSIEPRFGGRGHHYGGPPHGPLGNGHPGRGHWGNGSPLMGHNPIFGHGHTYDHNNMLFKHLNEWHSNHPRFGMNHHHCDPHNNHGYDQKPVDQKPWNRNGDNNNHNEPHTSNYPMETTTNFLSDGKSNTGGSDDIKPVSEPSLDLGNPPIVVKTSTPYPQIDIRSGV